MVEVPGACQNFISLKYQILNLPVNSYNLELENVVKIEYDVTRASNVTCGNFEHDRDFNGSERIFCCQTPWVKNLKNWRRQRFGQSSELS